MERDKFLAGAAREIITPPVGTKLFGYRPDVISESVNDDLTVTAVALGDGESTALLISVTVCELSNELCDKLKSEISAAAGVAYQNIVLCATHTHSGPVTVHMTGWGDIDRVFCDTILVPKTVKAAAAACASLKLAKLGIGTTESKVGINRRQITPDGAILLGQNPWGLYDPEMTVLNITALDGSQIVNIIHYCCHGTAAGCNREISRDWSGPMIDRLEEQSGCLTVFFNGAEGDIGPRLTNGHTTGDITYVRELGAAAASDAVRAYRSIKNRTEYAPFKVVSDHIKLPYSPLPPLDEVEAEIKKYEGREPERLINIDRLEYERLLKIKKAYSDGDINQTHFSFLQTLISLGPVVFVPFPFEIFVEVTLRLRSYSKFENTLCLSNSNGANSYFPTQSEICRGGYEIRAFRAGGAYCLTDDADNYIIRENLRLIGLI